MLLINFSFNKQAKIHITFLYIRGYFYYFILLIFNIF
jgi:hypothetical protein